MDHNTAIAAITRDAIAAIRALTSEAMTRLQGHATTSLAPMKQTDFTEVQRRVSELRDDITDIGNNVKQTATARAPAPLYQNVVGDTTTHVFLPPGTQADEDPADLVEMTEDQPQEDDDNAGDASADAEDVFENSTDTQPTSENTPAPTAQTTSALPVFDIAQNEIPDFGDDHFATLEVEAVRAMCRLLASAVMSRGLALSQVQAAIKTASDGTATAITPLTKDQAVALYRAFRLELLKVKA